MVVVTVEDVVEAAVEVSEGVAEVTAEAGEEVALTGEGAEEVPVVLTGALSACEVMNSNTVFIMTCKGEILR